MTCAVRINPVSPLFITDRFQIGAGAEIASGAAEYRHLQGIALFKFGERPAQSVGGWSVHGIAPGWPV
jgi:hypothetical protein